MNISNDDKNPQLIEKRDECAAERKEVRVWVDGCYDLVHFGHANLLRQAKKLGEKLVVGIHSDEEIHKHKGPPVLSLQQRARMVQAIKWVDEVVEGAPYVTSLETLDKHNCAFCVHGDDITMTTDGVDTYHYVKSANRYKQVPRTEGVSTTDLVARILLLSATENQRNQFHSYVKSPWTGNVHSMLNTNRIAEFSDCRPPKPGDKIVYVDGSFDMFHLGHLDFLQKASELGDYLIVGVYSDQIAGTYKPPGYPIMNVFERVLSVLACRYVNDVIIGAPLCVEQELLNLYKINVVAHSQVPLNVRKGDPYATPKKLGIFMTIETQNSMTTSGIVERIIAHRVEFARRNKLKQEKEIACIQALTEKNCDNPAEDLEANSTN